MAVSVTIKESALYTNFRLYPESRYDKKRCNVCVKGAIIESFASKGTAQEFAKKLRAKE